ncbi:C6 zinc finger domain protein [Penicillium capsulatum]|uniref:C6 zinc finger domain protein n=1 Tax=Penicillium capsulatum TaxID=69766 RepID=A0A9W9IRB7_9EURO|nr:C6 zinc finger domain protein [Penicillium capsulatum]KAJ6121890.1 C6 zinc finger domain protein [Penicillium capsulatum]
MLVTPKSQKSKLGCQTCKIRRVKCGEEKPACIRCTRTGRTCEYRGQSSISIASNPLPSLPNTVWRERRAFAYYFQQAAPSVSGGLDNVFWQTIVPQICRSEPAVWDAMISLSALLESPEPGPDQNQRDALGWYSRAVSSVRQGIERGRVDIFVGLISCMIFISVEALQGSTDVALRLYQQGVHLIRELRLRVAHKGISALQASWLEDTIVPIFDRLGTVALSVSGIPVSALLRDTDRASLREFPSLKFARETMILLAGETRIFQLNYEEHISNPLDPGVPTAAELLNQQVTLLQGLQNWDSAFSRLMNHLETAGISPQEFGTAASLSTYYEMHLIILETGLSSLQTATDPYLPNFQNIVFQSRIALNASAGPDGTQPPFTFDIGVVLPLWFTCLRCRDPTTRREAAALIRQAPQVQGVHKTASIATLAEKIIAYEETKATPLAASQDAFVEPLSRPNDSTADLIPEEARVGPIGVYRAGENVPTERGDCDQKSSGQTILQFSRNERDRGTGDWRVVRDLVPVDF